MRQKNNFLFIQLSSIIILSLYIFSCSGSEGQPEQENTILQTQFTFHQDVNKLYFGLELQNTFNDQEPSLVSALWHGIDQGNTPDTLILLDDGTGGDILSDDNIYALKINNDLSTIQNTLGNDSGNVYINFKVR
mgnify:CR=1 FL=1